MTVQLYKLNQCCGKCYIDSTNNFLQVFPCCYLRPGHCFALSLTACLVLCLQGIVMYLWDWIPEDGQVVFVIIFGAICYLLLFLAKYFAR